MQRRLQSTLDGAPTTETTAGDFQSDIDVSSLKEDSVVFSGIQPTGVPHMGNYLGALRQWKRMQDSAPQGAKLLFSVVDLHAITMPQDGAILRTHRREMMAALLAIGLDPERSTIFYQSSVRCLQIPPQCIETQP